MLKSGLLSVTFRQLPAEQIIKLVTQAKLDCIEWAGDIHAPHGNVGRATRLRQWCDDAGIELPSYGSYYRAAVSESQGLAFASVLDSAEALGVKTVRVWAGDRNAQAADDAWRAAVAGDLQRCVDRAAARGMTVSLEYHNGTLTNRCDSTRALLQQVDRPGLWTYWQPRSEPLAVEQQAAELKQLIGKVSHLHLFTWTFDASGGITRHPLADGEAAWRRYLAIANDSAPGGTRYAMLEFVKDEQPQQFLADAATLLRWLEP